MRLAGKGGGKKKKRAGARAGERGKERDKTAAQGRKKRGRPLLPRCSEKGKGKGGNWDYQSLQVVGEGKKGGGKRIAPLLLFAK